MKNKNKTKAGWIKTQPMNKPAEELIADAKTKGLEINANYVHSVRSEMRRAMRAAEAKRERKPFTKPDGSTVKDGAPITVPAAKIVTADPEVLLRAVASEIGLAKAIEILTNERKSVLALLQR